MSPTLISSIISGASKILPAVGGLFAHGFKGFKRAWQSMSDATTGAHLTGAQQEANAFEADQAQKQMQFQQQMRDSQYQSTVSDMKAAGINPALAMSNSVNAAPSGAMAHAESPGSPDVVGLLGQIQNLSLLKAEKRLKDAQASNLEELAKQNAQRTKNLEKEFDISSLKYEKDSIELNYFEEMQKLAIQAKEQDIKESEARIKDINSVIAKRGYEVSRMFVETLVDMANIQLLKARTDLTQDERTKLQHDIKEVDARIGLISAQTGLAKEEIKYYGVNHLAAGGAKVVSAAGKVLKKGASALKKGVSKTNQRILDNLSDDILGYGTNPYYIPGVE